jgi:hypothetical protein
LRLGRGHGHPNRRLTRANFHDEAEQAA